jgi:hypothetical protein
MKKHLWKLMGLITLLALLVGAAPLAADEAAPADPINRLRVYGAKGHLSEFPYDHYKDPFDITDGDAPEKDFVVFNPAILLKPQPGFNGDPMGPFIKADYDAGQKVHARMWYDPDRPEPMPCRVAPLPCDLSAAGTTEECHGFVCPTYPEVWNPDTFQDIVFEYTYIFIDDENHHPTSGGSWEEGEITQMVFPMAGLGGPIGLDRYDVGPNSDASPLGDGHPEIMRLEAVAEGVGPWDNTSTIAVTPQETTGDLRLEQGEWIEFFDYAVKVIDAPTTNELKAEVAIYYTGYAKDEWRFLGSTNLWLYDSASVQARIGPVYESWSASGWKAPVPIKRPFWVEAIQVGEGYVRLQPYRYLQAGESFFVDGAEYDVAAILTEAYPNGGPDCDCAYNVHDYYIEMWDWDSWDELFTWDPPSCKRTLKSITIQNPLPKRVDANDPDGDNNVRIKDMTVYKRTVPPNWSLPMLPPFNMEHDEVDDTNIPDCLQGKPNPKGNTYPDVQNPDNVPLSGTDGCGADYLDDDYDTIKERLMEDTPPYDGMDGDPESFIAWTEEAKEWRFDTNLLEEKFHRLPWGRNYFPLAYVEGEVLKPMGQQPSGSPFNFGPVMWPNDPHYGLAGVGGGVYWADCNGDGGVDLNDLNIYVNGAQVPGQWLDKTTGYIGLHAGVYKWDELTIDYCYALPPVILPFDEVWNWINVETHPWDYTEFILPLRPDVTDPLDEDGDYIVVTSWLTEDSTDTNVDWDGGAVRVKFVHDGAVDADGVYPADIYVNDAQYNEKYFPEFFAEGEGQNSLRVYGRCTADAGGMYATEDPNWWYDTFDGPFNLKSYEAPAKDFIVHNPALLVNDNDSLLFSTIHADEDAHEKVHMRTWYVPKYYEPRGFLFDWVKPGSDDDHPQVTNDALFGAGDIVNEYTYLFLDDETLNPTHGSMDRTHMVFPMASGCGQGADNPQVGLDRYDVNDDGTDEIMQVEYIREAGSFGLSDGWNQCIEDETTYGQLIVSPQALDAGNMRIVEEDGDFGGVDTLEFFDYAIVLISTSTDETKADFDVYYTGFKYDTPLRIGTITLWQELGNAAVVDASQRQVFVSFGRHFDTIPVRTLWADGMFPVSNPWGVLINYIGTEHVSLEVYRYLSVGETIMVDGAEYDIPAIGLAPGDKSAIHCDHPEGKLAELKYLTVRNPLPKCEDAEDCPDILIPKYTVYKSRFAPATFLPVLPPFNMQHDMVDDINLPELGWGPDLQRPDNVVWEDETCGFEFPPDLGLFWGCDSLIHELFNTIEERVIPDVDPFEFWWLAEEKEERFDTSLTEEKWKYTKDGAYDCGSASGECWQWINIETLPWDYTEFVLPELPDKPQEYGLDIIGDYLLVSSFITEDSDEVWPGLGSVRVKFAYDPSDGTGLYVNSDLCVPARVTSLTSNSPVDRYGDVELMGAVEDADSWTWDFGGLTGCTGEDTASPTCDAAEPGDFEVCLTAENDCPSAHTVCTTVEVLPCPGDFAPDFGFRDLADIMAMLPAWNTDCGDAEFDEMFDFDGDCHIGLFDIMQVVAVWNTECPGGMP